MKTREPSKSLQPIPIPNRDSTGLSRSFGLFYVAVPGWLTTCGHGPMAATKTSD